MSKPANDQMLPTGYAICDKRWLYDKSIRNELPILLEISSLCAKNGECYASNEYFAKVFGITTFTASRAIGKLKKVGYISIENERRGAEITKRTISLNRRSDDLKRLTKNAIDGCEKTQSTIDEKRKENITYNTSIKDTYVTLGILQEVKVNSNSSSNPGKSAKTAKPTSPSVEGPSSLPNSPPVPRRPPSLSFDEFWDGYDKKVGKVNALKQWNKLTAADIDKISKHMPRYVLATAKKFRKDPERYLKHRAFEDEIISDAAEPSNKTQPSPKKMTEAAARQHAKENGLFFKPPFYQKTPEGFYVFTG